MSRARQDVDTTGLANDDFFTSNYDKKFQSKFSEIYSDL